MCVGSVCVREGGGCVDRWFTEYEKDLAAPEKDAKTEIQSAYVRKTRKGKRKRVPCITEYRRRMFQD